MSKLPTRNLGKLTIPEQVDMVIQQAVNRDNLAVMYEGWTSWI